MTDVYIDRNLDCFWTACNYSLTIQLLYTQNFDLEQFSIYQERVQNQTDQNCKELYKIEMFKRKRKKQDCGTK